MLAGAGLLFAERAAIELAMTVAERTAVGTLFAQGWIYSESALRSTGADSSASKGKASSDSPAIVARATG